MSAQFEDHNINYKKLPDEIVISGFSGRLPESSNIEEFKSNLFNGTDMVNAEPRRWPNGWQGLPSRSGKIKDEDLAKFDRLFFGVNQKQAECMDPQMRMLLEATQEAIIDAGLNPQELRGSRTGVYIGVSNSEIENYWNANADRVNGYGLTGCHRTMFANRISYTFDFKGPSYAIDTACSSSMFALSQAFNDMKNGLCDSAIVGGVSLLLTPYMSLQFYRLGMLSDDGKCKAFDESGTGYVRSDGCVVMLLQKASQSRRIYSTILNIRTNSDGSKDRSILYPSGEMQERLMFDTYSEIGLNPRDVVYVEAHGTGTKVGDPQEVNTITVFFCKADRETPLLIGSVKSNMGHSEPASGICSIIKVLLAMEADVIPRNLHFERPNPNLYGIIDGRVHVVDYNKPWTGGIVGVNSFGFGGANSHLILKSNPKSKSIASGDPSIPRLVMVSGRTAHAVNLLLDEIARNGTDAELLSLVNEIHSKNIPMHCYRAYAILQSGTETVRKSNEFVDEKRPIWYIYSGTGSQWVGMAKELMLLDIFRTSIKRCAEALSPVGIDLMKILTDNDESTFEQNIVYTFVSIVSIQIGLTDVLTHLGLTPDGIIGHSVGELCCAYADGCFTLEQTILAAYRRGISLIGANVEKGMMAVVGLTWEEAKGRNTANIVAACHNSNDNVTISGKTESVTELTDQLSSKGVYAKIVKSSGYAFHSHFIAAAGPKYRKSLECLIPEPKNRSTRWISTSIPESEWASSPFAQQSSAAYHENNLLAPVLFHEAVQHIPKNAICIEIAPTGLLQGILKRSLSPTAISLGLMKRGHENNLAFFLENIGKLYAYGSQPKISKLYAPVSYPVGRGTPMLNSNVGWDHSQLFDVPKFDQDFTATAASSPTVIDVNLTKDAYLSGHSIDCRILYPTSGYMVLAWQAFAKKMNVEYENTPVVFEDVVFHRDTVLPKNDSVKFGIKFLDATGGFEISEGESLICSGRIYVPANVENEHLSLDLPETNRSGILLNGTDAYKDLRIRGYDYSGDFVGISESDSSAETGKIQWKNNWITFIDGMVQFSLLGKNWRELYMLTNIKRVVFNPRKHLGIIAYLMRNKSDVPVYAYKYIDGIKSGGIELHGLKFSRSSCRTSTHPAPVLERYVFIPFENGKNDLSNDPNRARLHAVSAATHLAIENLGGILKIKVADVIENKTIESALAQTIQDVIDNEPNLVGDIAIYTNQTRDVSQVEAGTVIPVIVKDPSEVTVSKDCHLLIAYNLVSRHNGNDIMRNLQASIFRYGFILLEENIVGYDEDKAKELFTYFDFVTVSVQRATDKYFILLHRAIDVSYRKKTIVQIDDDTNYSFVHRLQSVLAKAERENTYVYIVGESHEVLGAMGLINCLKHGNGGKFVRLIFLQNTTKFSFTKPFYDEQLSKDLIINVYKGDTGWGTYRHLKLDVQTDVPNVKVEHAYVNTSTKGDLSSLTWIESPLTCQLPDPEDERVELCTVYYAPINIRDVMLSTGKWTDALPSHLMNQDCVLGSEFSGRDSSGKRIMALVPAKSLATTCVVKRKMIWEIPSDWTMQQAAAIPYVYSTVYYALIVRGKIKRGESILIHSGSDVLGQAAINLALNNGLTVYATVDNENERRFLNDSFPQLTENIRNSHEPLEPFNIRATKGKGVDLILSSLGDEKCRASACCLGISGRFLEIRKFGVNNNSPLGLSIRSENISFHDICLDSIMEDDEVIETVVNLVNVGLYDGTILPLPISVYNDKQLEEAFRFMADGERIGKVIVKVRDEEDNEETLIPEPKLKSACPRFFLRSDRCYIITGGLGGMGLELANWMVTRGATKLVLTSRSGIKTGYQSLLFRRWRDCGIQVSIDTNDITESAGAIKLLQEANKLAPIAGIFHLAAVMHSAIFENQTNDTFRTVCKIKIDGTKHLDYASRVLCPELKYFVCFSSISSGRGSIGETNYGLANSAMERICERRKAMNYPAMAIQWGAIGDTGLIFDQFADNEIKLDGTLPQRLVSCLKTMDVFMKLPHAVVSSMVVAEKPHHEDVPKDLVSSIADILNLDNLKNVSDQTIFAHMGVDSLLRFDIKSTLARDYGIVMEDREIGQLTFGKLKAMQSNLSGESTATNEQSSIIWSGLVW